MLEVAQLIAAIAMLVTALCGFLVTLRRLREVHDLTNSRMTELLEIVKKSSYAEGQESERKQGEP